MTTYQIDCTEAVAGHADQVSIESHKAAMDANWNKALELAADLVVTYGSTSADLARQKILARKIEPPRR